MMDEPIRDTDGREVSVLDTGIGSIGIHSWTAYFGTPEQEAPTRSIFLSVDEARRVRDALTREINNTEAGRLR